MCSFCTRLIDSTPPATAILTPSSITERAATAITQALTATLARGSSVGKLASAAKAKVGEAARFVGEQAVQLHGGMGMTDELNVGHYLKRLIAINVQYGDPTFHVLRCAEHVFGTAREATSATSAA